MRQLVREAARRAALSGSLKKIAASATLLPPSPPLGVRFLLFEAENAPPALKSPKSPPRSRDPFAREHLERELFVTQLHGTHNLVLNKFAVVEDHVVLPTIEFEEQETPLDKADLRAMWVAMHELDAFAFFNCGRESGASQPHKHMQLISYPSLKALTGQDMPPLLAFINERVRRHPADTVVHLPELPFLHFLHRIEVDAETESELAADRLLAIYNTVLRQLNAWGYPTKIATGTVSRPGPSKLPVAYNLVLTHAFLLVVPRRYATFGGIEMNSLDFVGSLFVAGEAQRALFEAYGPLGLLREVAFPC